MREPHTHITVRRHLIFRWGIYINNTYLTSTWKHSDAIMLAGFLGRISVPATVEISRGPAHETGERREF